MKIGFNLTAISENLENYELVKDQKKYPGKIYLDARKTLEKLENDDHEVFLFVETDKDLGIEEKQKIKKQIRATLKRNNVKFSNLAIIKNDEVINAAKRNRIDIFVNDEAIETNKIKEFTDAINYNKDKKVDLLGEIDEVIKKERQPFMDEKVEITDSPSKDRIWDKKYRVGDFKWTKENMSPYDRIRTSLEDFMDERIMEMEGKEITAYEFFQRVDELANCLIDAGIKKGVDVPFVLANTTETLILLYALMKIKATIIPIYPLEKPSKLQEKLKDIDFNYIFVNDMLYGRIKEAIPQNKNVVILNVADSLPKVKGILLEKIGKRKSHIQPIKFEGNIKKLSTFLDEHKGKEYDIDTSYDDSYPLFKLYTGGTIRSKRVLISEKNIEAATKNFLNDRINVKRNDITAAFLPLNHVFGLVITTHVVALLGTKLSIISKINFKKIDKLFLDKKVTLFAGIPTIFNSIMNNKRIKKSNLNDLNHFFSGGSALSTIERDKMNKYLKDRNSKAEIVDGYGKTETTSGIIMNGLPSIGTGVKIVEPGTEIELGYDQIGELCLSGDQIFMKYMEEDVNEIALRRHSDGILWHHTEDTAYITKDGTVKVKGRLDRMIKVNGEQVHLDDIEEIIISSPFAAAAIVVKKLDKQKGEVPAAYVKLKPNYEWCDEIEEELSRLYEEKLPRYAIPKFTEQINEIPMTPMGKVDFKSLEREANLHEGKVLKKSLY
ncbi:MAG: class I adenylate-forming enzyme family protein [Bacilli bacterium]|nr:class I adenylate-forming enzyme family protein [Bacilli bacterium]